MPIQGFVRLRKHQFARQAALGTRVAATRAYGFKGTPSVDLAWTDPDVDTGSLAVTAAPYRGASNVTASLTTPALVYNDLPLMLSMMFGGNVTPTGGGTGKTWAYDPSMVSPLDDIDVATYEFGDDVTSDWFQLPDGMLESLEFTGPDGLGPISASMSWRFGGAYSSGSTDDPDSPAVPTAGLSVATDDIIVYLKDMAIYIASATAGLAAGQIMDALHSFTLRITAETDLKRFANATQTFDISAYGRTGYAVELECTFAKTADTVGTGSESDAWMSDDAVNRYVRLTFTSKAFVEGATPYSWTMDLPMRYYTRAEGEIGGNTTVVLTGHGFYDPDDLDGFFPTTVVNTLAEATLGSVGS